MQQQIWGYYYATEDYTVSSEYQIQAFGKNYIPVRITLKPGPQTIFFCYIEKCNHISILICVK